MHIWLDPFTDFLTAFNLSSGKEMFRTFNCGIGMVIIIDESEAEAVLSLLTASGKTADIIGKVISITEGNDQVQFL